MIIFFPYNVWALPASTIVTPNNQQWACQPSTPPNILTGTNNTYMNTDGTIILNNTTFYDINIGYNQADFGFNGSSGSITATYFPPNSTVGYTICVCTMSGASGALASGCNRIKLLQGGSIKLNVSVASAYTATFTTPCLSTFVSLQRIMEPNGIAARYFCQAGSPPKLLTNAIELHTWATIVSGFKCTIPLTVDGTLTGTPLFSSILPPTATATAATTANSAINAVTVSFDPYTTTSPQSLTVSAAVGTTISTVLVSAGAPTQVPAPVNTVVRITVLGFP